MSAFFVFVFFALFNFIIFVRSKSIVQLLKASATDWEAHWISPTLQITTTHHTRGEPSNMAVNFGMFSTKQRTTIYLLVNVQVYTVYALFGNDLHFTTQERW